MPRLLSRRRAALRSLLNLDWRVFSAARFSLSFDISSLSLRSCPLIHVTGFREDDGLEREPPRSPLRGVAPPRPGRADRADIG